MSDVKELLPENFTENINRIKEIFAKISELEIEMDDLRKQIGLPPFKIDVS